MKKLTLVAIFGLIGSFAMQAQTKQGVNATRMADPTLIPMQSQSYQAQIPNSTTQTISGFYQQGFEPVTFPPAGMRVENVAGPTYTWARSTTQAHLSTASAYMRYDAVVGGGQDWMIMPRYLVTASTDSLTFWMELQYSGYQPDSLAIKVSTTDSLLTSFTGTLLLLREGTNYPGNNTTWYRYAISLQNYVGQQIYLAFKHYDVDGDGLYVDDVTMGTRPAAEVGATALISPTPTAGAGTIVPQASYTNFGTVTQSFNVTTTITPGGYTSTSSITGLAPNTSAPATFAPWTATAGTYTLKTYSDLPGDANRLNDTLIQVITVVPAFQEYGWDVMNGLPGGRWATGPVFAKPCISATDTGYIYLISGADASFANTTLNTRYNTVTGTYVNLAPIPQSRTQISPVQLNGKIYVIGGYGSGFTPVTTNSIYNIATNTWTTGAPMPLAVGDYAVGVYADTLIYYVGGYSGSIDVNTVQIYNINTNTWSSGTAKIGAAVGGGRMGISGNKIVFVGGYSQTLAATQATAYLGTISPSTPNTIAWTSLPNYPAGPVGRHGSGVPLQANGLVYFAGGDPDGQGLFVVNAVYAYNTVANQWEIGTNMPVGVSNITNLAGIINNDSLYMVTMGGYNGVNVVTSNHWLNIGEAAPLPYAQNDTTVCDGSSIVLNAFNGTSYLWAPAATLSSPTVSNPTATTSATTTYTVTMSKGYGCPVIDQVVLTVNPLPTVVANSTATAVCDGSPVTLSGSGATSYTWTGSVTDNVAFNPSATDTYTVTGTDANGCQNTDNITVTVNPLPTVVANATATAVCDGSPVTLSGSGATSYTWTGSVTDNVAFNPSATDTYTVTGTDANGCQNTDNVTVTVNPLPTVAANATATAVCDGSPVTLSGSGATSYTWTGSVTDNVAFNPSATDTYTVTGTDANGCQNTDMITVTVNPLPTVTASAIDSSVCENTPVTLMGGGAVSYTWSGGVTDNVPFNATVTDTYTVTGTDANGCQNTASLLINVMPAPVVTGNASSTAVCMGAPVTLSGSGATSYTWTGSVTNNVPFTPTATNTYTVTGTDASGCQGSDEVTVTVNQNPNVTVSISQSIICLDDANLALTGGSPANGTWSGTGVSGSSFDPTAAGNGPEAITYTFTDANGCTGTAVDTITVSPCVGIDAPSAVNGINIYPNPSFGQFTIQLSGVPVSAQVEIMNALGQVVDAFTMTSATTEVNIAGFESGVYIVRIINGDTITVQRIVKK